MQQETAQKLIGGNGHLPLFVAVGIVLPTKGDLVAIEVSETVIADCHSMHIAGQILQYVFRSTERRLCIHDPFFPG